MAKKYRNKLVQQKELPDGSSEATYVREEVQAEEAPKMDFDAWFALRAGRIPKHHHKEILKADFKARGLGQSETLAAFDEALRKYGVKLD